MPINVFISQTNEYSGNVEMTNQSDTRGIKGCARISANTGCITYDAADIDDTFRYIDVHAAVDGLVCTRVSSAGAILQAHAMDVARNQHELVVYMVPDVGSDVLPDTPANQARFMTAVWHTMMTGRAPPVTTASGGGLDECIEKWFVHTKEFASQPGREVSLHNDTHHIVHKCWVQLDEAANVEQKLDEPGFGWMCVGGRIMIHFEGGEDPGEIPAAQFSTVVAWVRNAWDVVNAQGTLRLSGICRFDIAGQGGLSRLSATAKRLCLPSRPSDSHLHMVTVGDVEGGDGPGCTPKLEACIVVAGVTRGVSITSASGSGVGVVHDPPYVAGVAMDSLTGRWGVPVRCTTVRMGTDGIEWTDIQLADDGHATPDDTFKAAIGWLLCENAACIVGSHIREGLFEFVRGSDWIQCPSASRPCWRVMGHPMYRTYPVFVDVLDSHTRTKGACLLPGIGAHSKLPVGIPCMVGVDSLSLHNLLLHARGEGPMRGVATELARLSCVPSHDLCRHVETLVGICGLPWGVVSMPGTNALRYPASVHASRVAACMRTGIQPCIAASMRAKERLSVEIIDTPPGGIIKSVKPGVYDSFLSYDVSKAYTRAVLATDVPYLLVGWSDRNMAKMQHILSDAYGEVTTTCVDMTQDEAKAQAGCQSWVIHSPGMTGPFRTYLDTAKDAKLLINATVGAMGYGYLGPTLQQAAVAGICVVRHAMLRMLKVARTTLAPCKHCTCCHSSGEVFTASCSHYIPMDAGDTQYNPGALTDEIILPGVHPSCAKYARAVLQAAIDESPLAAGCVLKKDENGILVVWSTNEMIVIPMGSDGMSRVNARGKDLNSTVLSKSASYIRDAKVALFAAAMYRGVVGGPYGGWASAIESLRHTIRELRTTHTADDMANDILVPVENLYNRIGGTPHGSVLNLAADMLLASTDNDPLATGVGIHKPRRKRKMPTSTPDSIQR